jgi:hypothetical protein
VPVVWKYTGEYLTDLKCSHCRVKGKLINTGHYECKGTLRVECQSCLHTFDVKEITQECLNEAEDRYKDDHKDKKKYVSKDEEDVAS